MILEHSNYRSFLKGALIERQRRNPAYSMRAFASQIGVTQSTLSQVLSGKKNFSLESATRVASKLGLNESETEYFRTLLQTATTKDPDLKRSFVARMQALNPRQAVRELSVEFFSIIADWFHLPIKNMVDLEGFDFTPANIARRLGITKLEAESAVERLLRLEMIEADPETPGKYRKSEPYSVTKSAVPNEALRRFHRQMLAKAVESLETQTPQEKIVGSETFAISAEVLPEANRLVEEFFGKMTALSALSRKKTDVYHLGVQFFNLTKGKSK